jgi:hypothetical protein
MNIILLFPFSLNRFPAIVRRQVGRPVVSTLRLESNTVYELRVVRQGGLIAYLQVVRLCGCHL